MDAEGRATQEAKAEMVFSGAKEVTVLYSGLLPENILVRPSTRIPDKNSVLFSADDSGILPEQEAAISCVMGASKFLFE